MNRQKSADGIVGPSDRTEGLIVNHIVNSGEKTSQKHRLKTTHPVRQTYQSVSGKKPGQKNALSMTG